MKSAPMARTVDALTGAKAPDKFFQSLSEADDFIRRCDGVREQDCRLQELEAENRELRTALEKARNERDTWRSRFGRDL